MPNNADVLTNFFPEVGEPLSFTDFRRNVDDKVECTTLSFSGVLIGLRDMLRRYLQLSTTVSTVSVVKSRIRGPAFCFQAKSDSFTFGKAFSKGSWSLFCSQE